MPKQITTETSKEYTIALLIDAENISYAYIEDLLDQLKVLGKITIRRTYGDFTTVNLRPWMEICKEHSISPRQANMITKGKNNSDSALIIEAMDILHDHKVNAFCLATSDSDFTSLAMRIREEGYFVIGAGEAKTTKPFKEACDRFFKLGKTEAETVPVPKIKKATKTSKAKAPTSTKTAELPVVEKPAIDSNSLLEEIKARSYLILENHGGGNYIKLSVFINDLYRYYPDFNVKDYGKRTNREFFTSLGFEVIYDEKNALVIRG